MPPLPPPVSGVDRRLFLSSLLGAAAAAAGLSGCAGSSAADSGSKGSIAAPLADKVPSGTSLKIASYQGVQQLQFKLAGLTDLPFTVSDWVNTGAGPDVINAFRAKSLDVGNNAGIPPIQAQNYGRTDIILVGLLIYGVFGLVSDSAVRLIERKVLSWRRTLNS